jgi:hypothetical protein
VIMARYFYDDNHHVGEGPGARTVKSLLGSGQEAATDAYLSVWQASSDTPPEGIQSDDTAARRA